MRVILVPISHIAEESIRGVQETIKKEKPDCVAVELDQGRYYALTHQQASTTGLWKQVGISGFVILSVFKWLQQSLGKRVGILPGTEMLEAIQAGQNEGAAIAFIDKPIGRTFLEIKGISFQEKAKLLWFVIKGLTWDSLVGTPRKSQTIDLRKLPPEDLIDQALAVLEKEFPQLYTVLVEERNKYMAGHLKKLGERYETIVAVIGAGHKKGIESFLQSNR